MDNEPSDSGERIIPRDEIVSVFLPVLRDLRDDFSDEIPDRLLHSDDVEGTPMFKCRTSWFNNVVNMIRPLMFQITDPLHSECAELDMYMRNVFDFQKMRTREEIDMATAVLVKVIEYFEETE